MNSTYTIDLDGIKVTVTLKRVRNVNFRVGADGRCRMSVPYGVSRARAKELAWERRAWFEEHLNRVRAGAAREADFGRAGSNVMVWGEALTLAEEVAQGAPGCRREQDRLVVEVPVQGHTAVNARLVETWYTDEMKRALKDLLPECERIVGVRCASLTLRRMTSRWGSCTTRTGAIRLNVALAECPPACLRMVLIHELCHLREANHGPRFKALMDLYCPDWRASQRWLDDHPPRRIV